MVNALHQQRIAGRPQIDLATVRQGNAVQQAEAKTPGKEIIPNASFLLPPMPPKRPDIGIRWVSPPPPTQPSIGFIENGIGSEAGKHCLATMARIRLDCKQA